MLGVPQGGGRGAERGAGQRAAALAFECLGFDTPRVHRGPDGAPAGPPGTLVSIAHSARYALAAAWSLFSREPATDPVIAGVGVDVEGHRRLTPSARHLVSLPEETRAFAATDGWGDLTKLFAVKEALYKAGCAAGEPFRPRRLPARPGGHDVAVWSGARHRATVAVSAVDGHWLALCVMTRRDGGEVAPPSPPGTAAEGRDRTGAAT